MSLPLHEAFLEEEARGILVIPAKFGVPHSFSVCVVHARNLPFKCNKIENTGVKMIFKITQAPICYFEISQGGNMQFSQN